MQKETATLCLVSVLLVSLAACQPAATDEAAREDASLTAEEIADRAIQAIKDVKTYRFDMDMTMEMAGESEGEAVEATIVMELEGEVELENGRMRAGISTNIAVPDEEQMHLGMELYLMDDTMYVHARLPQMGNLSMWVKSEIPVEARQRMDQLESQVEFLETATVRLIGSDTVRGIDCYLLEVTPDAEKLWALVRQQATVANGEFPEVSDQFLKDIFSNLSMTQWIAKDTFFMIKSEIGMTVELTPEAMGFPEEEGWLNMDVTMTMLTSDHNQPVSIELPPAAENAIEVPAGALPQ